MVFDTIDKLRHASYKTRERALILFTLISVATLTFVWFIFFTFSLTQSFFKHETVATTTPVTPILKAPFVQ